MGRYIIKGGNKLDGKVRINGAKNSCLPIMAASVLNGSLSKIIDVPHLKDVSVMIEILQYLGATVTRTEQMLHIDI